MSESTNEFPELNVGDTVQGTVVKVEDNQVLVDIGFKTEGIVPLNELSNLSIESASNVVNVGDELSLAIKKLSDDEVILSKKAVDSNRAWEDLEEKYSNGEVFQTEVKEIVKGGLVADVGIRGFIPASLVEAHFVDDFSDYLNKQLDVKIVELDKEQNRIILSHRAVVEEEASAKRSKVLQSIEEGQVLEGTVQRITNFGVFVDLGGIDGLVHISQLAHEHVNKASDVVSEGETVKVQVLSIDRDNERISLSRKKVLPGPWANIEDKIKIGQAVEGTVKRLVNFGAFIEVLPNVEGLVHISQIANRHIGSPQEVLEVGQTITVKVLDINEADERMSLSIKEIEQEQEEKEYKQYQKDEDQPSFQFGDIIGDKLNKFK
ncbi:30S ribosomal protein S1 [Ornithinibacillus salinisoli]|uniref:30S ribosomal protein S1 n=1 Tax=Ornithinibacillus salinisoli TaxID=1848459 RepID=A0ABW4W339_9BACI